jgi:hypothetical protein
MWTLNVKGFFVLDCPNGFIHLNNKCYRWLPPNLIDGHLRSCHSKNMWHFFRPPSPLVSFLQPPPPGPLRDVTRLLLTFTSELTNKNLSRDIFVNPGPLDFPPKVSRIIWMAIQIIRDTLGGGGG